MDLVYIGSVLLLVFGFGFVIFWHELGHFLAAKWAGVKVEQFAVGFGQAMLCWRKGLGFTVGTSAPKVKQLVAAERERLESERSADTGELQTSRLKDEQIQERLGISETEYRLNWIPLGGYVKMLGQDDMDPTAQSDHPRAYNNKSIGKRMVIVSAGVIMNIILAIILFTVLFRIGFDAPPAIVGAVEPGSPAQEAGVRVGDRVLYLDGTYQHDFTKISMNVALLGEGEPVKMRVRSPDGAERDLTVVPRRAEGDPSGFLRLGIAPSAELQGPDPAKVAGDWSQAAELLPADSLAIRPGDTIVAINGQPVDDVKDYYRFDRAVQESQGAPIILTVRDVEGRTRQETIQPVFAEPYGHEQVNFAGMVPRSSIMSIIEASSARGRLMPGDVVLSLTLHPGNDPFYNPSPRMLRDKLEVASKSGGTVDLLVLRDGQEVAVTGLSPQTRLENGVPGARGLGIAPGYDAAHTVLGEVAPNSPAARAGIPSDATLVSVNGQPVSTWYEVQRILRGIDKPTAVPVVAQTKAGEKSYNLDLTAADLESIASVRYATMLALRPYEEKRQTNNPLTAAAWGFTETRDLTLQFYLTIRRMIQGSVPASAGMGPIGIFHQGSKIASRGTDWLIWFLAMISANLAVVNFLPIPIVDGGLFVFLIVEKLMGKPLSPRAQGIAQLVGLVLIAGVILFVTYNDIRRIF